MLIPKILFAQNESGAKLVQLRIKLEPHTKSITKKAAHGIYGEELFYMQEEGLEDIHTLNQNYKASNMQRLFPYAGKYEVRHREYGLDRWYTITLRDPLTESDQIHEMIAAYGANRNIEIAEPVYEKVLIEPVDEKIVNSKGTISDPDELNDPYFPDQWNLNNTGQSEGIAGADIGIAEAWKINTGDPDVVVAVIDGGIDVRHEDLARSIWVNEAELNGISGIDDDMNGYIDDVNGYSFVSDIGKITPHFHGIHVAGIIAGVSNNAKGIAGIAGGDGNQSGIKLMSCAIFNMTGSGGFENAMVYAADNGAVIAQNSWGYKRENTFEQSVLDAIDYFIDNAGYDPEGKPVGPIQGGLVVFAAGNENSSGLYYPGCYDPIIAVGSTDNCDKRSYFSNFGEWLDICAPGSNILSTYNYNTYAYLSGTSMACPHVSGVAGLLVSLHKSKLLHFNAIKDMLYTACNDIDIENPDFRELLGHGRLNASGSLMLEDTIPPSPVSDLAIQNTYPTWLDLSWTATGSDSLNGSASYYEIRYDTTEFEPENFELALLYRQHLQPAEAGETENLLIEGLEPETSYWIAMKAFDMMGNSSGISNIINASTPAFSPKTVKPDSLLFVASENEIKTKFFTIYNHGSTELNYEISYEGQHGSAEQDENGRLFALGDNSNLIYEMNPLNGDIQNSFPAPEATYDGKVGLAYDGSHLLFINGHKSNQIIKIDPETGVFTDTLNIPQLPGIYGLGASIDKIYASYNSQYDNIFEIDPAEEIILRTIDIGQNSGFGLTYAGERGSLFVTNGYSNIQEVDIATGTTVNQFTPSGPVFGAGYSNSLDLLFIGIKGDIDNDSRIEALDPNTGESVFTFLSDNANALAADETSYGGWLQVDPESGTIGVGDSVIVYVEINTTQLAADNYFQYLRIGTSNPFEPQIYLPVFLHVNGEAGITSRPGSLDFENTYIGYSKCQELTICNSGTDSLSFNDIYTSGTLFTFDTTLIGTSVYKNDSAILKVYFHPQNSDLQSDTLYIQTNASNKDVLEIPLSGTGIAPPHISLSADTFMLSLDYMQKDSLEFTVGNHSGGSGLQTSLSLEAPLLYSLNNLIGSATVQSEQRASDNFLLGDLSGLNIAVAYSLSSISKLALDLERRGAKIEELDVPLKSDLLLNNYDILIIGSLIPHFKDADMEKIRKWNRNGGGLWIINDLSGMDEDVNKLLQNTGLSANNNLSYERITNLNTQHYTTKQVDTLDGTNYQTYYSVSGQAEIIGRDDLGYVRLAASQSGDGKIFVFGAACLYNCFTNHTDTRLFLNRVVDWLGNRSPDWLAIEWQQIELAPGQDSLNRLIFHPQNLTEYTYRASVLLRSNDPAHPEILVPCTMQLSGDAEILTDTDTIIFDTTFTGYSAQKDILISNSGTGILHIDSTVCSTRAFRVETFTSQVDPGKSVRAAIYFEPETEGKYADVIYIFSNAQSNNPTPIVCEANAEQSPDFGMIVPAIIDTVFVHDTLHYQLTLLNRPHSSGLTYHIYKKKYFSGPDLEHAIKQETAETHSGVWDSGAKSHSIILRTPAYRSKSAPLDTTKEDADVLLIHDDISDLSETQWYLSQYPELNVSSLNADSVIPELSYLLQFEAVMVGNEGYWNNSAGLGNVLAEYADMDGGLIFTVPTFHNSVFGISGRILQEGYLPFTTGVLRLKNGEMIMKEPTHPIVENVETASVENVLKDISLKEDADFVAAFGMGIPFIGTRRNVVGINLYIGLPGSWTGDIPLIQRNAIHYLADVPFLNMDLSQGYIESGENATINLTIDGSNAEPGDSLAATLIIQTNDPTRRFTRVPVFIYFDYPSPQVRKPIADDTLYLESPPILIVCDSVFSDISGNGLEYSAEFSQAQVAELTWVSSDTLLISPLAVGATNIILTATDTVFARQVIDVFTIQVVDTNNVAPSVITEIDAQTLYLNADTLMIGMDTVFYDANKDSLSYSVSVENTEILEGRIINNQWAELIPLKEGNSQVTIFASDHRGGIAETGFPVVVLDTVIHESTDQTGAVSCRLTCYPNPAQELLVIKYAVEHPADVELAIYGSLGLKKHMLYTERKIPGFFSHTFDISGLQPGVYIVKIKIGETRLQQKVIVSH